ncbi:PfkB family carbohydrate kinase [Enterococcus sp. HY326]|uniref:PfkB family carbohydrate kinase n=1 Tax=Enterococcus sp. HY326 TaxID=2971265 RepID=UPI00223F7082|nr:PfkB family carbohydrate kinase [Enterococcus sp. HY326]
MNIKDIAKLAGVSVSTVSKIVNGKDDSIRQETRERVLRVVKEYNYSPYSSKITPQKRSWTIGVLLNSTTTKDSTLDGILSEAQKNGYSTLVLNNYNNEEQELKNITTICKANVDAIIWEPVSKNSLSKKYLFDQIDVPLQTIGVDGDDNSLLLPYESTAFTMTKTLIEKGHKKIACLVKAGRRTAKFIEGYKKAFFENGLQFSRDEIYHGIDDELLHKIGKQELTGIVVSTYVQAMELYSLVNGSNIQIPENFSLIAIQNDRDFSLANSHIKISSVIVKNADFGKIICQKIIKAIENKSDIDSPTIQFGHPEINNFVTISKPYDLHAPKVTVIGSINIDTYLTTPEIPVEGKSIILSNITNMPGGKGLNQAIGVAKLGHRVSLIGKIGKDLDSDRVYKELEAHGINTSNLIHSKSGNTGKAYIFVQPDGESMISILPGANYELSPKDIETQEEAFEDAEYCLMQTEIPLEAIEKASDLAHKHGAKTILKPATAQSISKEMLKKIDILVPNEDYLTEFAEEGTTLEEKATWFLAQGVKMIIVTRGAKGSFLKTKNKSLFFESSDFPSIDSTGAGDAFISAMTAYLMYGNDIEKSISIATAAAGFSISRDGVIPSLIDKQTLDTYISKIGSVKNYV